MINPSKPFKSFLFHFGPLPKPRESLQNRNKSSSDCIRLSLFIKNFVRLKNVLFEPPPMRYQSREGALACWKAIYKVSKWLDRRSPIAISHRQSAVEWLFEIHIYMFPPTVHRRSWLRVGVSQFSKAILYIHPNADCDIMCITYIINIIIAQPRSCRLPICRLIQDRWI